MVSDGAAFARGAKAPDLRQAAAIDSVAEPWRKHGFSPSAVNTLPLGRPIFCLTTSIPRSTSNGLAPEQAHDGSKQTWRQERSEGQS